MISLFKEVGNLVEEKNYGKIQNKQIAGFLVFRIPDMSIKQSLT